MILVCRAWHAGDADVLRPMIRDLLDTNMREGFDLLPTDRNVETLLTLGMKWAGEGEPTVVACNENDRVVGFTLWGSLLSQQFDVRPPRLCSGVGTYVLPEYRRHGVSAQLRQVAMRIARESGYGRVKGTAYHAAALASVVALGFRQVAVDVEVTL